MLEQVNPPLFQLSNELLRAVARECPLAAQGALCAVNRRMRAMMGCVPLTAFASGIITPLRFTRVARALLRRDLGADTIPRGELRLVIAAAGTTAIMR